MIDERNLNDSLLRLWAALQCEQNVKLPRFDRFSELFNTAFDESLEVAEERIHWNKENLRGQPTAEIERLEQVVSALVDTGPYESGLLFWVRCALLESAEEWSKRGHRGEQLATMLYSTWADVIDALGKAEIEHDEIERLEQENGSLGASQSADSTPSPPLPGPPNTITGTNAIVRHLDIRIGDDDD